jgi:Derlin-2/3
MRYSRMLEESSFANRKADYFWLLFLSSLMLLVRLPIPLPPPPPVINHSISSPTFVVSSQGLSPLFNLPFLSSPLAYVPIYFWSRRHPSTPISLFGLLTITAPYLPFALVAFSWVLTGTWRAAASDLVGCAVGHVGWFIRDVWTREMVGGPTILSEAPEPL